MNKYTMKNSGFSLIEIMMVIGIVAILVALASPGYQHFVRKANRTEAQTDLLKFAGYAERIFTQDNSYVDSVVAGKPNDIPDTSNYIYTVAVTANTYTITATPDGSQSDDACEILTYNQRGDKTSSGPETHCWE